MTPILIEDKSQKTTKHLLKHAWFERNGIYYERYTLPVADYIMANDKVMDVIERKQKRGMEPKKMDFLGTYTVAVDTKRDIQELVGNVCGKEHDRFRDELLLGQNNGIKVYILVENNSGVREVRDLFRWQNPRLARYNKIKFMHSRGYMLDTQLPSQPPTSGQTLAKALLTMEKKYGCTFVFCTPQESGKRIIELLSEGAE